MIRPIKMFIRDIHIGTYHVIPIIKNHMKSSKLAFTKTDRFDIIDRVIMTENQQMIDMIEIVSSTGRKYNLESFLTKMDQYCDVIDYEN